MRADGKPDTHNIACMKDCAARGAAVVARCPTTRATRTATSPSRRGASVRRARRDAVGLATRGRGAGTRRRRPGARRRRASRATASTKGDRRTRRSATSHAAISDDPASAAATAARARSRHGGARRLGHVPMPPQPQVPDGRCARGHRLDPGDAMAYQLGRAGIRHGFVRRRTMNTKRRKVLKTGGGVTLLALRGRGRLAQARQALAARLEQGGVRDEVDGRDDEGTGRRRAGARARTSRSSRRPTSRRTARSCRSASRATIPKTRIDRDPRRKESQHAGRRVRHSRRHRAVAVDARSRWARARTSMRW